MASHYKVELGQAIRGRREELGLTQKDLAELTHYTEAQTVSRWERGENLPSDLETVASALQWTLADLVAGIQPADRRTARRFGQAPEPSRSQLDRIEQQLSEIHDLLLGDGAASVEEVLDGLADRLLQAGGSLPPRAAAPQHSRQASRRRKSA